MKAVRLKSKSTIEALNKINSLLIESADARPLEGNEIDIFHIIWDDKNKSYQQIADDIGMSKGGAIKAADRIYKIFKYGLNIPKQVRLTKGNLRAIVEPLIIDKQSTTSSDNNNFGNSNSVQIIPKTQIGLNHVIKSESFNRKFYINRNEEDRALVLLSRPGTLLRIIGEKKSGKTLFLKSILDKISNSANTVEIDIKLAGSKNLSDPDDFCKWLCQFIALKLKLPVKQSMEEYWIDGLGGQTGIINYFDEYLLKIIDKPLILAFDNLRYLFIEKEIDGIQSKIADDILSMLRGWHLSSRQPETEIWQKLRLILAYRPESSDEGCDLTSPIFNLGEFLILNKFNIQDVLELSKRYDLNWEQKDAENIVQVLEGNPYLMRFACEQIKNKTIDVKFFLSSDFKNQEPFKSYLKSAK